MFPRVSPYNKVADLENFLVTEVAPGVAEREKSSEFPRELLEKLHGIGFLNMALPHQMGGKDAPLIELLDVARAMSYVSSGFATAVLANTLGATPFVLYANEDLRNAVSSEFKKQFNMWSFCVTEKDVGFDLGRTKTVAQPNADGFLLNGRKDWIINAGFSNYLTVFANIESPDKQRSMSAFYVPCDTPGVKRDRKWTWMGNREMDTASLIFENVQIPKTHLLGDIGSGYGIMGKSLGRSKTCIAGLCVGICDRVFDIMVARLRERIAQGEPVLMKPPIYKKLAYHYTQVQAAWLLARHAAESWQSGERLNETIAPNMAKLFASDVAMSLVSDSLEMIGATAYLDGHELSRIYRDVKLMQIYEGSRNILETQIGKEILVSEIHRYRKTKSFVRQTDLGGTTP